MTTKHDGTNDRPNKPSLWREYELEGRSREEGIQHIKTQIESLRQQGRGGLAASTRPLIFDAIESVAKKIDEAVEAAKGMWIVSGKRAALRRLEGTDTFMIAYIALQAVFGRTLQKKRSEDDEEKAASIQDVSSQIGDSLEFRAKVSALKEHCPAWLGWANKKRKADTKQRKNIKGGGAWRHTKRIDWLLQLDEVAGKVQWKKWGEVDKFYCGMACLNAIASTSSPLITIDAPGEKKIRRIRLTEHTVKAIKEGDVRSLFVAYTHHPMLYEPRDWSSVKLGGYLSNTYTQTKLVRPRHRDQLEGMTQDAMPKVYRAVNTLQKTKWRINRRVLEIMQAVREENDPKNDHLFIAGLADDAAETSTSVYLKEASEFVGEKALWFPVNLDFRGRLYYVPQFCPHSHDMVRGVLEFSDAKPCEQFNILWLLSYGERLFFGERVPRLQRVEWGRQNAQRIQDVARDPLTYRWWMTAEEPTQFLAWCLEWDRLRPAQNDDTKPKTSRLPLFLDQHASGVQNLIALARAEHEAPLAAMTSDGNLADIYVAVTDHVMALVEKEKHNDPLADKWSGFGVTRKLIKKIVMTRFYNAGKKLCQKRLRTAISNSDNTPFTKEEIDEAAAWMQDIIWRAIHKTLPGCMAVMGWLGHVASVANKRGKHLEWTSPAGFRVRQRYIQYKKRPPLRPGAKHLPGDVQFEDRNEPVGIRSGRAWKAFAPNFIHSLDASVLCEAICLLADHGIKTVGAVHDCLALHVADYIAGGNLARIAFHNVHRQSTLDGYYKYFRTNLTDGQGTLKPPPPQGTYDIFEFVNAKDAYS